MTVPARVNLVTLGVSDLDRETRFYQALGWRLSGSSVSGEVSFFDLSNVVLALWGHGSLAEDARVPPGEPPEFRGVASAINVGSEAEVDAVIAAAVDAGGSVAKLAHKADWGGYSGYFADPEGHLWEVAHNPYWPLDANGLVKLPE
jgi:catechol 2,3-dioxygenase-like lactoylglutathione lyase family enzyme